MPEGICEAKLPPQTGPSALLSARSYVLHQLHKQNFQCVLGLGFPPPRASNASAAESSSSSSFFTFKVSERFFIMVLETHYESSEGDVNVHRGIGDESEAATEEKAITHFKLSQRRQAARAVA